MVAAVVLLLSARPPARLSAQAAPAPSIAVSANPVTAAPVTLHWPAIGGQARVDIFTITGLPVTSATPSDTGRWQWDLTTAAGRPVVNGAYLIVVTLSDNTRLRRRLLVAR